jgi:hypothetical protein
MRAATARLYEAEWLARHVAGRARRLSLALGRACAAGAEIQDAAAVLEQVGTETRTLLARRAAG